MQANQKKEASPIREKPLLLFNQMACDFTILYSSIMPLITHLLSILFEVIIAIQNLCFAYAVG